MNPTPGSIQIHDQEAIQIVIAEAERRGISKRGGRQIAAAIIKDWASMQEESDPKGEMISLLSRIEEMNRTTKEI